MAQKIENVPIQIQYGHTDTHVVIQFSKPVTNLTSTPEHTRAMIDALQNSLKMLGEHQQKHGAGAVQAAAIQHDREGRN